jgi:hypothetical protein
MSNFAVNTTQHTALPTTPISFLFAVHGCRRSCRICGTSALITTCTAPAIRYIHTVKANNFPIPTSVGAPTEARILRKSLIGLVLVIAVRLSLLTLEAGRTRIKERLTPLEYQHPQIRRDRDRTWKPHTQAQGKGCGAIHGSESLLSSAGPDIQSTMQGRDNMHSLAVLKDLHQARHLSSILHIQRICAFEQGSSI